MQKLSMATGLAMMALGACAMPLAAHAQAQTKIPAEPQTSKKPVHRVVVQVSQNDPAVMNVALNNAENMMKYYQQKGEKIEIEFVAYGPGLHMMRSDTSPVKDRLAELSSGSKNITFSGCGNTLENQSRQENKTLTLLPQAHVVPAGIARIVDLEEQGWTYVRP